jgi:hypothetical protein
MLGRCDRASIYFVKNQCAEVYSATRRRTRENKGHVNYDLSDVPVKACAAPTTGSGCHSSVSACVRRCEKLSIFLVRAREGGSAKYTPPTRS